MPSAVGSREDYSAEALRGLARRSKDVGQSRRLLSLAGVRDGMDRGAAARIGGMDRQTLRDWVHRFNASGPEGLVDNWTEGPKPRLSAEQAAEFAVRFVVWSCGYYRRRRCGILIVGRRSPQLHLRLGQCLAQSKLYKARSPLNKTQDIPVRPKSSIPLCLIFFAS
jgi:Winged helix-turn helix